MHLKPRAGCQISTLIFGLRKVLGDLISLIRFPIMERKYFTNEVSTKNVLTLVEKVEIFQSFHDKPIDTFPEHCCDPNTMIPKM
jgi:hypothetical protein